MNKIAALPLPPGGGSATDITNPALSGRLKLILANEGGAGFFSRLLPNLVGALFGIGMIYFFFRLLLGAIDWIGSGGDKAKTESARGKISGAIIGLLFLFSTFALTVLIEGIFGINILKIDIDNYIIR